MFLPSLVSAPIQHDMSYNKMYAKWCQWYSCPKWFWSYHEVAVMSIFKTTEVIETSSSPKSSFSHSQSQLHFLNYSVLFVEFCKRSLVRRILPTAGPSNSLNRHILKSPFKNSLIKLFAILIRLQWVEILNNHNSQKTALNTLLVSRNFMPGFMSLKWLLSTI